MLFPYERIRHPMRAMHGFVAFIFANVWCRAPYVEYGLDLFETYPALHAIMTTLHQEDLAGVEKGAGAFFYHHINQIFNEFKLLSSKDIELYRKMFKDNNNIRELCDGKKLPTHYVAGNESALMQSVEVFFSKLYRCGFFELAIVKQHIGADLKEHYKKFSQLNSMPSCPFCGLQPMDSEFDSTREAYDHYLPASKYPFNSVNLKNLAPACHKCNSQYKSSKDPLLDELGIRKKAFYPYTSEKYPIEVHVHLKTNQLPTALEDIEIELRCAGYEEELETWDRLYQVRERYAARCLSNSTAKYWIQRVTDERHNYRVASREVLLRELENCSSFPWYDANFLKNAFLADALRTSLISLDSP